MTTTTRKYEANTQQEAWAIADKLFPGDYEYDSYSSNRAGYPMYFSTNPKTPNAHINDLNTRLEVCLENGDCINIWFTDLYWMAIENVELKQQIVLKDEKIAEWKKASDQYKEAYNIVLKRENELESEIKALKAEVESLKKNGYGLVSDLIA